MKIDMSCFLPLLAVVFITLKLLNVISWPWVWVLAPVWGWFAMAFLGMVLIYAIIFFGGKVNVVSHR